jgi:hypothetical protein
MALGTEFADASGFMLNELCDGFQKSVEKLDPKDEQFGFDLRILVTRLVQAVAVLVGDYPNGEIPALMELSRHVLTALAAENDLDPDAEEPDRRACRYRLQQTTLNLLVLCHTVAEHHTGSARDRRRNVGALKNAVANALGGLVGDV